MTAAEIKFGTELLNEYLKQNPPKTLKALLRDATIEQIEGMIEDVVAAAPNLFVVARGLRAALQDDWEKSEVAELLMEGVEFP